MYNECLLIKFNSIPKTNFTTVLYSTAKTHTILKNKYKQLNSNFNKNIQQNKTIWGKKAKKKYMSNYATQNFNHIINISMLKLN